MTDLRPDNTPENCVVPGDPEGKTGRPHYWHWVATDSRYIRCSTCGREQYNSRLNGFDGARGVAP